MIEDGPEETDNVIQISGTPEQAERAQSLLQGFILSSNTLFLSSVDVFFIQLLICHSLTDYNFNLLSTMQPWKRIEECGRLKFHLCFYLVDVFTICISLVML